jgi:aryl-alcohol dehydrogenase
MQIKAAVIRTAGAPFQIETVDLAPPKTGEILIKIAASGICHTDEVAQQQIAPVPLPAVLGHEGSGVVEAVGLGVQEFKAGDHVVVSFGFCGHCENCLSGHQHACDSVQEINFGGIMRDGTKRLSKDGVELSSFFGQSSFATYSVAAAASAVKIPDDVDFAVAAPLACGVQTGAGVVLNALRATFGSSIVVFGCGTVGMSAIMAARIAGCENIIGVGGNPASLALATELGATHTINLNKGSVDVVAEIADITRGGAHYAIDTTGAADLVRKALASVRTFGTAVVVGVTGEMTFNVNDELMGSAKSLVGITSGNSIPKLFIPQLLRYYKQGRFPIDRLIKRYRFEEINEAQAESKRGEFIKAVLMMS